MSLPVSNSMVSAIRRKVRHLTNSPNENSLTDNDIDEFINDIYNTDFPYAIKLDQMRSVYTFYTQPYIDRYPVDVNYMQGFRAPVYIDGVQGGFYKDRQQFYNLWPRLSSQFQQTSNTFQIQGPFLRGEVMIGGVDQFGNAINIRDDGQGNLQYMTVNPQVSIPPQDTNPAKPGMYNTNTGNPGLINPTNIGSVDYVAGNFSFTLPGGISLAAGTVYTVRVSQYQTGLPYSIMFWNNEIHIRPVPKKIHKIELEVYLTPVQFMESTDVPILNQWWKYIAYLVAAEVQRDRNDLDSVQQILEGAQRQEALVLERQSIEEIGQPNFNIFNSTVPNLYLNNFWGSAQ